MKEKPTKRLQHYLNGAWFWQKKKEKLSEDIEKLRSQAEKMTTSYQDAPVFGGFSDHRQEIIAEMVDKQQKYKNALEECNKRLDEIQFFIDSLQGYSEDYQERIVLEFRYIRFMNWQDIAWRLNYTERQIYNIHGTALMHLLEIHKKMIENGRGLF